MITKFDCHQHKLRAIATNEQVLLEDDKVFRPDPDGTFPESGNDVGAMVNLFAGYTCLY